MCADIYIHLHQVEHKASLELCSFATWGKKPFQVRVVRHKYNSFTAIGFRYWFSFLLSAREALISRDSPQILAHRPYIWEWGEVCWLLLIWFGFCLHCFGLTTVGVYDSLLAFCLGTIPSGFWGHMAYQNLTLGWPFTMQSNLPLFLLSSPIVAAFDTWDYSNFFSSSSHFCFKSEKTLLLFFNSSCDLDWQVMQHNNSTQIMQDHLHVIISIILLYAKYLLPYNPTNSEVLGIKVWIEWGTFFLTYSIGTSTAFLFLLLH